MPFRHHPCPPYNTQLSSGQLSAMGKLLNMPVSLFPCFQSSDSSTFFQRIFIEIQQYQGLPSQTYRVYMTINSLELIGEA